MPSPTLIHDIGQLVTLAPLARDRRCTHVTSADLGLLSSAWLAIGADGRIAATGTGAVPEAFRSHRRIDAQGGLVTPGLVDSHTHAIWAGSRAHEFVQRLDGVSYQEIAARGGGIRATMKATRQASDEELLALLTRRLGQLLRLGVTTVEVKSGYGLSVPEELRLLRIIKQAKAHVRQEVAVTCLALHAASPDHGDVGAYVNHCVQELLPAVAAEGLARWVDAFVESGYFEVEDVEPYVQKAKDLGLGLRLHADEFTDSGAALAAAAWGAASADHLQCMPAAAIPAMARAGVVATLLPGTSLYARIPFTQGRPLADAGVPVAIASDFNPGSCLIDNLPMLMTVAAVQCGLRPAEAVAGVTYVAARSLGVEDRKGALAVGYDADLLIHDLPSVEGWVADFGRTAPRQVWVQGEACP